MSHRCFFVPPHILANIARVHARESLEPSSAQRSAVVSEEIRRSRRNLVPGAVLEPPEAVAAALTVPPPGSAGRLIYDDLGQFNFDVQLVRGEGDPAVASQSADNAYDELGSVRKFYKEKLGRNSIDNAGLNLVANVNFGFQFNNAFWDGVRMVFGEGDGVIFKDFTGDIDVTGHELTHGVTQYTAGLNYTADQTGALNESFSDIFGVIIANYQNAVAMKADPNDLSLWTWEIGAGLASGGGPLRNFKDPTKTGDPDHKSKYVVKPANADAGGVHTNSNIHNKAAYNVLTAVDAAGNRVFTVIDVAKLYYYTLTRLSVFATFLDTRTTLKSIAKTIWAGNPPLAQAKCDAIDAAYDATGIQ